VLIGGKQLQQQHNMQQHTHSSSSSSYIRVNTCKRERVRCRSGSHPLSIPSFQPTVETPTTAGRSSIGPSSPRRASSHWQEQDLGGLSDGRGGVSCRSSRRDRTVAIGNKSGAVVGRCRRRPRSSTPKSNREIPAPSAWEAQAQAQPIPHMSW
jgi:hypothetical protein